MSYNMWNVNGFENHLTLCICTAGENAKDEEEYDMDICADNSDLLLKLDQAAERGKEKAIDSSSFNH